MFFQYKISYYDPIDDCEKNEQGLVWGRNYSDAAEGLMNEYGTSSIEFSDISSISLSIVVAEGEKTINIDEISEALGMTINEEEK